MALEPARLQAVPKPWGSRDLLPWSGIDHQGVAIGEIWLQRHDPAFEPALLLKLLFTCEALSIQVHPGDDAARAMGLTRGKTEAWYVLAAEPGATVAVGLQASLSGAQLRVAIEDGSIVEKMSWRTAAAGDVIFVPAGTIHAIGPGLVLAEIQQRSDTTFRLFDHGRGRELHVESGIAAANAGPAAEQAPPRRLGNARTLLVASPFFVLERLEFTAGSVWKLRARPETWLIVIAGDGWLGPAQAGVGEGCFAENETLSIEAGEEGLTCLVAYAAAAPSRDLLRPLAANDALTPMSAASRQQRQLTAPAVSPTPLMEARP
ncbi:class I mannose-6-phosphate isomerase [Bosea vestrisii]|uniref:class I mannose-6-phosphate isomerase n=1 Tax=Bosea vestrisii TaxID=151416 RepID=UPI0024DF7BC0|nr:class I mannose-6-phosphate isomerase [Bosea vestrisii]WID98543.1 class I mannose-6-phosphate isomerase [Bosea vestrisii]